MTQRDAAALLDKSVATLRNYESGKTPPSVPMLYRMAALYGVGVVQFFGVPLSTPLRCYTGMCGKCDGCLSGAALGSGGWDRCDCGEYQSCGVCEQRSRRQRRSATRTAIKKLALPAPAPVDPAFFKMGQTPPTATTHCRHGARITQHCNVCALLP